ncbi:MAG: hypothetical protein PHO37_14700 [Kiritimatiellae bacterium]|nr:hypothetical protein [Kiritimatiellia bacterium]
MTPVFSVALLASEQVSTDIRGNESTSLQLLNRDQKLSIALSSTPSSTLTNAAITLAGLQAKTISSTGVVTTNWYDSLGRGIMFGNLSADVLQANPATIVELEAKVATSDSRNTFNLTGYNAKGQVEWSRDAASNNTWYAYNAYGQRYATIRATNNNISLTTTQLANEAYIYSLVDNEDFSVSYTAYSSEGQVLATWGNAYPVAYEYDDQNRMIAMATTRDENLRSGNLLAQLPVGETLSTWQPAASDKIDITKWQYDSATGLLTDKVYADGHGPAYTYTSEGKLSQRTWARGITTDYAYDFVGSLTNVVYNDTTPAVVYTYNRLGQQLSAVTSVSTNIFVYSPVTLELDYELQNGAKIDRSTDTLGRNTGYALYNPADPVNPVQEITYGFDSYGRFFSVSSGSSVVTNEFDYSYLPDTDILSGYTASTPSTGSTILTVSKTFELNRNLITTITNSVGSVPSVVSSFDYINDTLGRRIARSDYYINRGSTEANTFGYNTFSEVTNAHMGTNTYSYAYDPIGNRDQAVKNAVATDYEANGLNQYTNITGGLSGTPTFDLDGNMTFLPSTSGGGAGGWHCQWDAENRLIGMSNLTTAVVSAYTYDHQSRRIFKTTLTPSTPFSSLTSKFIYDGWNLIHEQTSTNNSSFIPHNSSFYVWGLDLSGSLQGAGGVGGLLSETKVTNSEINTYYALADANGNITEYLDDSGTVVAHYEYDAFGNTSDSSGDMDDDFIFRFSSKYLDAETGLYYYGYRYYDPVTGRWLSRDPIEEWGGNNLYHMIFNSIVNAIDAFGLGMFEIRTAPVAVHWETLSDYQYNTKLLKNGKVPGFEVKYIPDVGECPNGSRLQMSKALDWQFDGWAGIGPYFDNARDFSKANKTTPGGILPPPSTSPSYQPYGVTSEVDAPRNPKYFIDVVVFEICVICCSEGEYKIVGCFTFKFDDKTRKVKVKQGKKWNDVNNSWYKVTPESEPGPLWEDAARRWREEGGSLVK